MTQIPPLVRQRSFSQAKLPTRSGDKADTHPRSPSGATRNESRSNENNAHPVSFYPVPNVVSDGVTTSAADSLLRESRGLLSSTDDHHSEENSGNESNSGWRDRPTVSGASTFTTFIPAPPRKRKVPPSLTKPVKRHNRGSISLDIGSRINVKEPSTVSNNAQRSPPTVSNLQVSDAKRQRILQQRQAFLSNVRSHGTFNEIPQLYQARSHSASPFAVRQQNQKPSGISLATRHYTISQDHTRGEDARRSDLFASFRRTFQKQPETQAAPMDLFHADKSPVTSFGGGGMELANPLVSEDVLANFDFDSFLLDKELVDDTSGH
ncbi:hypothetical protein FOCG_17469 [Fusarium oxysporum f. sp. radicis-lycopersici 26381]|nr:hypothetical protein FOCG_17469 [Fusarium oxysporum f. sp. radicis-lycopersici 26381]